MHPGLDRDGYLILPNFLGQELLRRLRSRVDELYEEEGGRAGSEFRLEPGARRLANLGDKGDLFLDLASNPAILHYVRQVLGNELKLSSLNARCADPRSNSHQPLHVDQGLLPDDQGNSVCNVVLMLDDFTPDNGALRAVPGTHKSGQNPVHTLANPSEPQPGEILVTGTAGTAVIMNAHLWHGGTANRTTQPRRAIHAFYCRRDKPQQQYQKRLLKQATIDRLTPEQRHLLAIDDPLNDELSAATPNMSGFLR
ncbi:MAG: phytanoyl-CoA dioxygenase family protein [Bryobacterales bacterium]|nr:phytanoyl-CoA dioxygenase family protein [Bryobacterales bacterium]